MLEYVFMALFVLLFVKPMRLTPSIKLVELSMLIYVSYKQPLMGILCAAIFIRQFPVEGMVVHKKTPVRMALDEQVRPKESNSIRATKTGGVPPEVALSGLIAKPYVENHTGNYTPF
jgi:hypothetical protein